MAERDRSRSPRAAAAALSSNEDIYNLIVQREQARLAKDWAMADSLRDSLNASGVTLFDKTQTWKAADGRSGRIPTFNEIEAGASAESLALGQTIPLSGGEMAGAELSATEVQIKSLIQAREQARASKDFAQSDSLRDQLKAMGVEIFDKDKMWRAKSGESGCIIGYRGQGGATDLEINTLVVQREKARQSSDFATADKIRQELKQFGVDILDKEKIWRSTDGRQGPVPSWTAIQGGVDPAQAQQMMQAPVIGGAYVQSPYGVVPGVHAQAHSMGMVGGQDAALRNQIIQAALAAAQNPAAAGRTLQLLQQATGQPIMPQPMYGMQAARPTAIPQPTAGGRVAPEAQEGINFISQCKAAGRPVADAEIEWLVGTREKLRQNKDFSSADSLRQALRSQLGVELYEKEKRWVSQDGRQGQIPLWDRLATA